MKHADPACKTVSSRARLRGQSEIGISGMRQMGFEAASTSMTDQAMKLARSILADQAHRRDFSPDDALIDVGLSSLDLVNLMVAIEAEFDIMIPAAQLTPETFRSIRSIARMVEALRGAGTGH